MLDQVDLMLILFFHPLPDRWGDRPAVHNFGEIGFCHDWYAALLLKTASRDTDTGYGMMWSSTIDLSRHWSNFLSTTLEEKHILCPCLHWALTGPKAQQHRGLIPVFMCLKVPDVPSYLLIQLRSASHFPVSRIHSEPWVLTSNTEQCRETRS